MVPGTSSASAYDSKIFYLSIFGGRLAQRVDETTEGAEKRVNSEDRVVYEKFYKDVTGMLDSVELKEGGKYGDEITIRIKPDQENIVQIQMGVTSEYAQGFLKVLPNIDLSLPITLMPYNFEDKENKKADGTPRKVVGVSVKQNGAKVLSKFTFENQNGFPFPPKGEDGKSVYLGAEDFKILRIQQLKFLKEQLALWNESKKDHAVVADDDSVF